MDTAAQMENAQVCNKDVQIKALSSNDTANQTFHDKETQAIGTKYHNKKNLGRSSTQKCVIW